MFGVLAVRSMVRRLMVVLFAPACVATLAGLFTVPVLAAQDALKVGGSSTVNPVVAEAAEALRQQGMKITVDPSGGSSGGIAALGEGRLDVAMSSRPLNDTDRQRFPAARFTPTRIGVDAVALVVSRDVWEGGVTTITRADMQGIYEGRIRRWSALGGPDRRIAFFNKEVGRGTWEVFATWLYGDADKAPLVSFPEVGSNEETRNKVAATRGGISQLSAAWADGRSVFALAVGEDGGKPIAPDHDAVQDGRYPISRPLYLITDGAAERGAQALIDYVLGAEGQGLVAKHGYLGVTAPAGTIASP